MREVPYEEQTLDHPNPIARFAHRARLRLALKEAAHALPVGGTLLDYGAGQGRFLFLLRQQLNAAGRRSERLVGFDPFMKPAFDGVEVVNAIAEIAVESVDCLTVLEVCEHLDEQETEVFFEAATRALKPGGVLLVTVPIVIGPVILLKEAARMLLFRRWTDLTLGELFACALWGKVPRRAESIKHSHRGYDWRETRRVLAMRFGPVRTSFSPFAILGPWLNSQALLRVQLRCSRE